MTTLVDSSIIPHKFNFAKHLKAKNRFQTLGFRPRDPLPEVKFCLYLRDCEGYTRRLWANAAIYYKHGSHHKIILGMNFINKYVMAIKGHSLVLKDNKGHCELPFCFPSHKIVTTLYIIQACMWQKLFISINTDNRENLS